MGRDIGSGEDMRVLHLAQSNQLASAADGDDEQKSADQRSHNRSRDHRVFQTVNLIARITAIIRSITDPRGTNAPLVGTEE